MTRSRLSARSRIRSACCDALEPRRLLTYSVSGTPGDDLIEVLPGSAAFTADIKINGQVVGTTADTDIRIFGLGGNDEFVIRNAPDAPPPPAPIFDIKLNGGPGDDLYRLGSGKFTATHFFAIVRIVEEPDAGFDQLIIDNTSTAAPGPAAPNIREDRISNAFFDANLEVKQINYGSAADNVVIESVPAGLQLMLGGGDNTVTYGGAAKRINGNLAPGLIVGGTGTTKVIFDDSNGDSNVNRDYEVTPTGFMNQTLQIVGQVELKVRKNITGTRNNVLISGNGTAGSSIKITGDATAANATATKVFIGTPSAPIDLDNLALTIEADIDSVPQAHYEVWNEDADQSTNPFILDGDNNRQVVQKGGFTARLRNGGGGMNLRVNGGSASDVFHIRDVLPNSLVTVFGGGGDDTLFPVADAGHNNAPQYAFIGASFHYDGGAGSDWLFLDDTLAPIGAGNATYRLSNAFIKNNQTLMTYNSVDRIHFTADAGHNSIYFNTREAPQSAAHTRYVIDGGPGNDYITNFTFDSTGGALAAPTDATITGGAGVDTLAIDDTLADSKVSQYRLTQNTFVYSGPAFGGTFLHDASLETLWLAQGNASTTTILESKRPAMALSVAAGGGNDTVSVGGGDLDNGWVSGTVTLGGGTGIDVIEFDDRNDISPTTTTYTLAHLSFGRGPHTFTYGGFEHQTIRVADGLYAGMIYNVVNINAVSGFLDTTTIVGSNNRPTTINVGNGNLGTLAGPIHLNMGPGTGSVVNVNDFSGSVDQTFEIFADFVRKTGGGFSPQVNFTGTDRLNLHTGSGNDLVAVYTVLPGGSVGVFGNGGNDQFNVALAFSNLQGPVSVNGGAGTDIVRYSNQFANGTSSTLTAGAFIHAGHNHGYSTVEQVIVAEGANGAQVNVQSISVATTVMGGSGNDTFSVGGGDIDANIPVGVPLLIDGGFGTDRVFFEDTQDTPDNDSYTVGTGSFQKTGSGIVTTNQTEERIVNANDGNNLITVASLTSAVRINANGGNDNIRINDSLASAPVTVNSGSGNDSLFVNFDDGFFDDPATAVIDADDEYARIDVLPSGRLIVREGATLVRSGGMNLQGTLDLAGGALLNRAGTQSLAGVRPFLLRGYNGGLWNGTSSFSGAINSSLAAATPLADGVGYGLAEFLGISAIGSFSLNPGDILVRYTLDGDADLYQSVDIADFSRVATNFNLAGAGWTGADFNYDNTTSIADFSSVAANFNSALPSAALRGTSAVMFSAQRIGQEMLEDLWEGI